MPNAELINAALASAMTEAALLTHVLAAAKTLGWRSAHFRPARTANGWRTAVSGDGVGFPDLVLVNPRLGQTLFVELKAERGKGRPEQIDWHQALKQAGQRVFVWYPSDWISGRIVRVLEGT